MKARLETTTARLSTTTSEKAAEIKELKREKREVEVGLRKMVGEKDAEITGLKARLETTKDKYAEIGVLKARLETTTARLSTTTSEKAAEIKELREKREVEVGLKDGGGEGCRNHWFESTLGDNQGDK